MNSQGAGWDDYLLTRESEQRARDLGRGVQRWFSPPVTRDAKLIGADPLPAPWSHKPRAHLFFGLYSKAAPLERGNLIFWTWSRKTENWVMSWRVMISIFFSSGSTVVWFYILKAPSTSDFSLGWSHTRSVDLMQIGGRKSIALSAWCEGCSPNYFPFESSGAAVLKDYLPSFFTCGEKCTLAWHSLTGGRVYDTDFPSAPFLLRLSKNRGEQSTP